MEDDPLTVIEHAVGSLAAAITRYEQLVAGGARPAAGSPSGSTPDAASEERLRKLVLATEELKDRLRSFQEQ
jgi:hypothetical protein